jgi:hypothetical protein
MEASYWPPNASTIGKQLDRLAVEPHSVAEFFVARKPLEGSCS